MACIPSRDGRPAGPFVGVFRWLGAGLLDSSSWSGSDGSENTATELPRGPKIAVLPFLNLGDDPEEAYFAQGITDQIVTDLARFKAMFVLSMQSTAKYQEQSADPQRLRRELGIGERAIALNPNDPEPLARCGLRLVYVGEWERGLALVTKAIALNPEHPGWYEDPIIYYYYQTRDYERALVESQRREVPRTWRLLFRAMILGQLGRSEEAQPAIEAALKLKPEVRERLWDMARVWTCRTRTSSTWPTACARPASPSGLRHRLHDLTRRLVVGLSTPNAGPGGRWGLSRRRGTGRPTDPT